MIWRIFSNWSGHNIKCAFSAESWSFDKFFWTCAFITQNLTNLSWNCRLGSQILKKLVKSQWSIKAWKFNKILQLSVLGFFVSHGGRRYHYNVGDFEYDCLLYTLRWRWYCNQVPDPSSFYYNVLCLNLGFCCCIW